MIANPSTTSLFFGSCLYLKVLLILPIHFVSEPNQFTSFAIDDKTHNAITVGSIAPDGLYNTYTVTIETTATDDSFTRSFADKGSSVVQVIIPELTPVTQYDVTVTPYCTSTTGGSAVAGEGKTLTRVITSELFKQIWRPKFACFENNP